MTPPTFEQAKNHRQKVRAAGLSPDYWYPVEWDRRVKPGQVIDVSFWGRSIAVFRGKDGSLNAVENRCAHRQLKLSLGVVGDCTLTCAYHGWMYDGDRPLHPDGPRPLRPHVSADQDRVLPRAGEARVDLGVSRRPRAGDRHGRSRHPGARGAPPWGSIAVDFTWRAHHSMIIDNVSDFTHAYLHRKSKPFTDAKLTMMEPQPDRVLLAYDTKVGQGRISGLFVDRKKTNTNAMRLGYEYPYQWSNTDDKIKHWCFVLPIDGQTTRVFFIFYFSDEMLKVPLLPLRMPRPLVRAIMAASKRLLVAPLLAEDGVAVEAEQEAWMKHFDQPIAELNPVVHLFQQLTVRKWEEHLARSAGSRAATFAPALSG